MAKTTSGPPTVELTVLRAAIQEEYAAVALTPEQGFHFHTGRPLAALLGYADEWFAGMPDEAVESFAGTGNPFLGGVLPEGSRVVDVGCGAGFDSMIAARMVGHEGEVVGVDMTPAMLAKARAGAALVGLDNVTFREGFAETLPVEDGWADVLISNGVFNLVIDKPGTLKEWARVLRPGGRMQIGDILVDREVPESAKADISLWTG